MQTRRSIVTLLAVLLLAGCGPAVTTVRPTSTAVPPPTAPATAVPPTLPPTPAPPPTETVANQVINAATAAQLEQVVALDLPDSFVNAIAFSPDGRTMFTGDRNGEVLVWERDTWEKTTYLPAQSTSAADAAAGVYFGGTLALSPDGNLIVTVYGEDGAIAGRDREGQVLFAFSYGAPVYCMAISPDGKFLAVGGLRGNVIIFDLETRQPVADLVGDHEYISNLVFSRDSKTLLVCYERPDNVMKTWDTSTWQETATFTHVTERIDYHDVLFSPDNQELVIASTENVEIKFLDLATKQVVKEFPEHTRAPYQLAFSPDGSLLASASDDGTLRLWNVETGDCVKMIRTNREAGAVAFSPDGTLIVVSVWGEGVQVWSFSQTAASSPPIPTSAPLAGADTQGGVPISLDSAAHVELLRTLEGHSDRVIALAFSGDGAYVASSSQDKTIKLWDVQSWQEVYTFQKSANEVIRNNIAFSPDGRLLASAEATWDVESKQVVHTLEQGRECPVAFSPDGSLLAVAPGEQPVELWDVASGQVVRTLDSPTDDLSLRIVHSLAFSPDGKRLATGGGTVRLWDVASGQIVSTLGYGDERNIHGVAFSPDGAILASGGADYAVRLLDVASGQVLRTLRHGNGLNNVAFSPDGSLLASAGCDRTVKLWDVARGRQVRSLPHGDEVMAVAFSPDGTLLASGGYDNQVYLWGVPH